MKKRTEAQKQKMEERLARRQRAKERDMERRRIRTAKKYRLLRLEQGFGEYTIYNNWK